MQLTQALLAGPGTESVWTSGFAGSLGMSERELKARRAARAEPMTRREETEGRIILVDTAWGSGR